VTASSSVSHRGYSLSTLFLLIAASAVVVGMVSPVLRGEARVGVEDVIGASLTCSVLGLVLGGLVGSFHYSRLRGVGWGLIVGTLIGAICGPIMFIPPAQFSFVFSTALGGSLVILGVATVIRLTSTGEAADGRSSDDEIVVAEVIQPKRHPLDPEP
jgi:hypothetical protein